MLALLRLKGSPIFDVLEAVRSLERKTPAEIQAVQDSRLASLLRHAWENTEYYREILSECGVVNAAGKVNLERFDAIPFLTKDIIRDQGTRLKSRVLPKGRKAYANSSGGSTGQPIHFWQDSYYWDVLVANKIYHFEVVGKQLGEPEMKIWGSEKDLFEGTIGWKARLQNFLYNRKFEQCFHLPQQKIHLILQNIEKYKPKIIWCYRDGMDAIAKYVVDHKLQVHSPAAIICGGGTIYPHIEQNIQRAFKSPVINFYGSREMGGIACQCLERLGLHITAHSHKVEVINQHERPVMEEEGELVVTSLANYAMPFIRYRIGDQGKLTTKNCPCGRAFPLLDCVSGRVLESFTNCNGDQVDAMYFIHLIGVVYNRGFVKRFQVVQEDYSRITVKMILEPGSKKDQIQLHLDRISEKIQLVMGEQCKVLFEFVDEIPLTKSGKHLYTIRKLPTTGGGGLAVQDRLTA